MAQGLNPVAGASSNAAVQKATSEGKEAVDFAQQLSDINKMVQQMLAAIEKINSWWNKAASC
jgi:hypothetical protein